MGRSDTGGGEQVVLPKMRVRIHNRLDRQNVNS